MVFSYVGKHIDNRGVFFNEKQILSALIISLESL